MDTGGEQFHGRSSREVSVEEEKEKACVTPATIRDEGSSGFETRGSYCYNKKLKLEDSLVLNVCSLRDKHNMLRYTGVSPENQRAEVEGSCSMRPRSAGFEAVSTRMSECFHRC